MSQEPITIDMEQVKRFVLAAHGMPRVLARSLTLTFSRWGRELQRAHTREFMSGQRGSVGLNRVTGHLARTARSVSTGGELGNISTTYTFGAPYAAVHEAGGLIDFPSAIVERHAVKAHKRRLVIEGKKRKKVVLVSKHMRGPYRRNAYQATYKPRLQANATRMRLLPLLIERVGVDVDKVLEEMGRKQNGTV